MMVIVDYRGFRVSAVSMLPVIIIIIIIILI